ncbi:molybdenum ABC transporter ATP-binding protein [Pseudoroseomonas globiformis]|uniref:Molybdenum ABC transporter ATP-binding protein n=1 Tax=Teichococcus globiformis TaxID=2307229 RepID=A0ABV7G9L2_9PROT
MLQVQLQHRFRGTSGFSLDVDFAAPAAGVTAVFGPSGCGKSTLLTALAGLLMPQHGRIVLGCRVLLDTAHQVALPPEQRRCGMVFQDARLFPHLSVHRNLRYGERRAPAAAQGPDFASVVELLGIDHLLARRPGHLSGGEKQRVALGRALLSRPSMLLMDEPLAALDAARKAELLPFLARLRETLRVPVVYVTHALDEVDQLADFLVLMENGQTLASGTVEVMSTRTDLPLVHRRDAGAVLPCRVLTHDRGRGLTRLSFAGGEIQVPLRSEEPGTALRLRILARDVSIATVEPRHLSMQNVLPGVLQSIKPVAAHEAMLHIRLGDSTLLARVTQDAVSRLGLAQGASIWALVKSVAFTAGPAVEDIQ